MATKNPQRLLKNVDTKKQEKFRQRLKTLRDERKWSRSTWQRDVDYAKQTVEMVEELLTDIQTEIARIDGAGDHESRIEQIKKEFGRRDLEDLESRELGGGYTPTLKNLKEEFKRLADLRKRENEWKAYQYEIESLVREKIKEVAEEYHEDFIGSDVAKHTLEKVEQHVDSRISTLEQELHRKVDTKVARLETALEVARKEAEYYRDFHKDFGEVTVESIGSLAESVEKLEERVDTGTASGDNEKSAYDGLADENGNIGLGDSDEELPGPGNDGSSQDQNRDGNPADEDGPTYRLKDRSLDEQYEELQRLAENEDVEGMSQREIARLVDVSRPALFADGQILDKIENQHGSRPLPR